jgi:arylsulfatase A-like enzyme
MAAALGALTPDFVAAAGRSPPNILFILADDMGYADLGCYGSRHIRTPVLDRLAAEGVKLTDAYSNSPVCSPTRLALVTGCYQTRWKTGLIEPFSAGEWGDHAIPDGQPTWPAVLRKAGYETALIGKWHLGDTDKGGPRQFGYEHFFGFLGGGIDYFTHEYRDKPALRRDGAAITREGYMTQLLADEAIQLIRRCASTRQRFALSLHFNAPHWPWEGPEDRGLGTHGPHYDGGSLATYARMVESMDHEIGRLLAELEKLELGADTLVIFTSDNGGERFSDVWPFRGRKGLLLEGGIRVPVIVRFPRQLRAGVVSKQQMLSMDWMPTLLDAAGVSRADWPQLDGMSMLGALAGRGEIPRELFWKFQGHHQRAALRGRWKYYRLGGHEFLFDVAADSMERANRAQAQPATLKALADAWETWNEGMANDDSIPGFCDQARNLAEPLDTGSDSNCRPPKSS